MKLKFTKFNLLRVKDKIKKSNYYLKKLKKFSIN